MGSKRLTQEQINRIRALLLERKHSIESNIHRSFTRFLDDSTEETTVVDVRGGDESRVDVGKEMSFQVISRRSAELKQIKDALFRIEKGEYGNCEECSNPIRFERLQAMPFAPLCRDCQQEAEQREKERGRGFRQP
jgi:DnaK suppressor protein